MAKNNKLINSLNEIARRNRSQNVATAADQMVPQIYAAIAIALHRTYGFGYKRINDVFVESQHIWESYAGDGAGMVKKCEEETGVTVCSTRNWGQTGKKDIELALAKIPPKTYVGLLRRDGNAEAET